MGGPEPLPAVPQRGAVPASRAGASRRRRAGGRAGARAGHRRARLGRSRGRPAVRRSGRPAGADLRARRRERELSFARRASGGRASRRCDSAGRDLHLVVRRRHATAAPEQRALHRGGAAARASRPADHRRRGHHAPGRQRGQRHHRNPGARFPDRRHGRFHRLRRRQSRPSGRTRRYRFLLSPVSRNRRVGILPPEPRGLRRRSGLRRHRGGAGRRAAADRLGGGMGPPRRALGVGRLPPLALFLPVARRARARGREPADRGDVHSTGLHRRDHRERTVRLAARPRMPAVRRLPGNGAGPDRAIAGGARPGRQARPGPHARHAAADRGRQRHPVLRTRRRHHPRAERRAHAVRPRRPAHDRAGSPAHSRTRTAGPVRATSRRTQAASSAATSRACSM